MPVKTKRGVFPANLTPFESYMFVDDSPQFPMTFVFQFDFLGQVDQEAFQTAVDRALLRHPMLRALIQPAKGDRDCWVLADDYDSSINFADFDTPVLIEGASEYIDLRNEIGFRGWIRSDSNRTRFIASFHHSAVDGIGGYYFINDVLWYYAQALGNEVGELPTYVPQELRGRLRATIGNLRPDGNSLPKFDHYTAQPVLPHQNRSHLLGASNEFPQFLSRVFDKHKFRELRLKAQDRGQTLNDCLLESLMISMLTWNQQHGGDIDCNDFCILMPMDLRKPKHPKFSAANLVTSSFIRRSASEIQDRAGLTSSLLMETTRLKHQRHESEFMKQLISAPLGWNQTGKPFDEHLCRTSAIFSNAGDPIKRFPSRFQKTDGMLQCGNLLLDDINGASPLRNQTRVSANAFTYRRQLKIGMRCDPQFFTNEDGQRLLDHFVDTFLESLDSERS